MRLLIAALLAFAFTVMFSAEHASASDGDTVSVHIVLPFEIGTAGHAPHSMGLGGATNAGVIVRMNMADVQHVLLQPTDLKDATLTIHSSRNAPSTSAAAPRVALYRLLRDVASPKEVKSEDYAEPAIADAPLIDKPIELHGTLRDVLNQYLTDPGQDHGLYLRLENDGEESVTLLPVPAVIPAEGEHVASLTINIQHHPNVQLFTAPVIPVAGTYTTVRDGHLFYKDQRLRLWGVCRHFWGDAPVLDRLKGMGFNALRLWGPRNAYDLDSARNGVMRSNDGSVDDADSFASFDKYFADAKQRGFFILMAGLHYDPIGIMQKGTVNGLDGIKADDSFIAQQYGTGQDWNDWKAAITKFTAIKKGRTWHGVSELTFFDKRLSEIYRRHTIALLNHLNPYTGKKYADDEAIAVWEMNNEEGFVSLTSSSGIDDWPLYFQEELKTQWCEWLNTHYQNDEGLRHAWGALKPGETLTGNHVELAPFLRQRNDYPSARGSDVVHFLCDIANSFDDQMRDTIRAQARPGIGAAIVPITFDTISQPSVPWMYTESRGDAMSFGTYQFSFHSSLTVPPGLFIMDNQSVLGKPSVIYETEADRPCPFRAEYPLGVAALAAWQDWDAVFWHYWKGEGSQPNEGYLAAPMDYSAIDYLDGGIYPDQDPAYCATLSIAGQAFLNQHIAPCTQPAVHEIPMSEVYSYTKANGVDMRRDTFTRGAVAAFTDSANTSKTLPSTQPSYPTGPVICGKQITYDWQHGRLIIDTPTMKAYIGQVHGAYRFADGIVLNKVSTPFVAFSMLSGDGRPLAASDGAANILYTSQFDAKNFGAKIDLSDARGGEASGWNTGWSNILAEAVKNRGSAPALADPVSFEIAFPTSISASVSHYDFALRCTTTDHIDSNIVVQNGPATFMSRLNIESRGQSVVTPQSDQPTAADPIAPGAANPLDRPDPILATMYSPLPLVDWGEGYDEVEENISDSTTVRTSLSKELAAAKDQGSITVMDAQPLIGLPPSASADLTLKFDAGHLLHITAVFKKSPPSVRDILSGYNPIFGEPVHDDRGVLTWKQGRDGGTVTAVIDPAATPLQIQYDATPPAH